MMADLKKAGAGRMAALMAMMGGGQGGPPSPSQGGDIMTAPGDEDDGQGGQAGAMPQGEPTEGSQNAPGPSQEAGEDSDPVSSIAEAQEAIQKAMGSAQDPKMQAELGKASGMLQEATQILAKYYEGGEDEQQPPEAEDEQDTGPAGQSEGTDYSSDGK